MAHPRLNMRWNSLHAVNGALAACVLGLVAVSIPEPSSPAWVVIVLLGLAFLWNIVRLGQRLFDAGGTKDLWHLLRTLLFWGIGSRNVLFVSAERAGTAHLWLGWAFLVIALADTWALLVKERNAIRTTGTV